MNQKNVFLFRFIVILMTSLISIAYVERGVSQTLHFPEFTSLPSEKGWIYKGDNYNIFSLKKNGVLIQNSIGLGASRGHFDVLRGTIIRSDKQWSLKVRARVLEIEDPNYFSGFFFNVFQNDHVYSVRISPDAIYIAHEESDKFVTIIQDNTEFHDFLLTGGPDAFWLFSIDSIKVAKGIPLHVSEFGFLPSYEIAFGDGTSVYPVNAHGEWASLHLIQTKDPDVVINDREVTILNLRGNYPNPFNDSTTIEYEITRKSNVRVIIYNMNGQLISQLENEVKEAGRYSLLWDGSEFNSGVYYYQVQAAGKVLTKSMLLIK